MDIVCDNFEIFVWFLLDILVYYVVKVNLVLEILIFLESFSLFFDCVFIGEIEMVLVIGVDVVCIFYGNMIKKEWDIVCVFVYGVWFFVVDCIEEVEKIVCVVFGFWVFCWVLCDGFGVEWLLFCKFGCDFEMVFDVLEYVYCFGFEVYGVFFYVGF